MYNTTFRTGINLKSKWIVCHNYYYDKLNNYIF